MKKMLVSDVLIDIDGTVSVIETKGFILDTLKTYKGVTH